MGNSMLDAIRKMGPTGASSVTHIDSAVNLTHEINLIARVYAASCQEFMDIEPTAVITKVDQLVSDEVFMLQFARRGKISDGDAVAIREALRWTGIYVTTGRKPKFMLALIEDYDHTGENVELAVKGNTSIWNSFLIDDFEGVVYEDYGKIIGAKGKKVNVLQKSVDLYDVKM